MGFAQPGLKPIDTRGPNAALKRRSFTALSSTPPSSTFHSTAFHSAALPHRRDDTYVTSRLWPILWQRGGVAIPYQNGPIDSDARHEAYLNVPQRPTYAPVHKAGEPSGKRGGFSILAEVRLGSLIAAGGMVWTAYVATSDLNALWHMQILPPGPIEVCALGILVWLHAKWRRSVKAG